MCASSPGWMFRERGRISGQGSGTVEEAMLSEDGGSLRLTEHMNNCLS